MTCCNSLFIQTDPQVNNSFRKDVDVVRCESSSFLFNFNEYSLVRAPDRPSWGQSAYRIPVAYKP